jgi:hypothetical protein
MPYHLKIFWWARWESNPHALRPGILSPLRIPVPPRAHRGESKGFGRFFQGRRLNQPKYLLQVCELACLRVNELRFNTPTRQHANSLTIFKPIHLPKSDPVRCIVFFDAKHAAEDEGAVAVAIIDGVCGMRDGRRDDAFFIEP